MPKPSFDMTVQALTGLMSRLGEPGEPPIYLGMGSGDADGGLLGGLGSLPPLAPRGPPPPPPPAASPPPPPSAAPTPPPRPRRCKLIPRRGSARSRSSARAARP